MGLFGSEKDEREEVTLGVSKESDSEKEEDENNASPEIGTVDFGGGSDDQEEESGNLRNEVSRLDSVREESISKDTSTQPSTGSTQLEDLRKQNQQIIEKLDMILSEL